MRQHKLAVSPSIEHRLAAALRRWQRLWRVPGLASLATIRFSTRLTATAGRCALAKREVVLSAALLDGPEERLLEVLCHEAAHLAAHLRLGRLRRLHGEQWAELVRKAGFEPTRRLSASSPDKKPHDSRPRRWVVMHTCPVCHTRRVAKRAVPQWRCAECVAAGLPGRFVITRTAAPND